MPKFKFPIEVSNVKNETLAGALLGLNFFIWAFGSVLIVFLLLFIWAYLEPDGSGVGMLISILFITLSFTIAFPWFHFIYTGYESMYVILSLITISFLLNCLILGAVFGRFIIRFRI